MPLRTSWVCLNLDALVSPNRAKVGGTLSDGEGHWIMVLSKRVGSLNILRAKYGGYYKVHILAKK